MDFKFWGAAPGGFFENPIISVFWGSVFRVLGFGWYVGPYHWGVGPILGMVFREFFFSLY